MALQPLGYKRNERGQALELAYLDERGRPVVTARPGSARRRFTYDTFGRLLERADLDIDGKPMTNGYGYSVMRYAYDELGREAAPQTLDVNGRALNFKIGADKVMHASVAAESGFRAGDIILTYDGEAVTSRSELTNRLELFKGEPAPGSHREARRPGRRAQSTGGPDLGVDARRAGPAVAGAGFGIWRPRLGGTRDRFSGTGLALQPACHKMRPQGTRHHRNYFGRSSCGNGSYRRCALRNRPVWDALQRATSSGVPVTTTSPPA